MQEVKQQLHAACMQQVQANITAMEAAIADARASAANETKSSAGDKYETAREMMQQDINMNLARIAGAKKQLQVLEQLPPDAEHAAVYPGCMVHTTNGNYYISISAGKMVIDNVVYICISIASPIGIAMKGKEAGDSFAFNGKKVVVIKVF